MRFLIGIFLFSNLIFCNLYSSNLVNTDGDEIFNFTNKRGTVSFNHSFHQEFNECEACHPIFKMEFDDTISIKNEAHLTCKGCHKKMDGPTKCTDCHKK